ncbi:Single-stranded DNA-binding protein 2, partial [Anabarilius grahami]
LALYVYEYLLHVGAQKSAQTFLSEIRWEKNITLGEPPGFLHSWWCVFWDLYCAAPERRETCEHSSEAKAFHDYSGRKIGLHSIHGCFLCRGLWERDRPVFGISFSVFSFHTSSLVLLEGAGRRLCGVVVYPAFGSPSLGLAVVHSPVLWSSTKLTSLRYSQHSAS